MTISTETSTVTYVGNGATTLFTFPFIGVNSTDLEVIYTNASGTETTLVASQYTLVINPTAVGALWGIGGSVTYPTSGTPIQVGTFLTINRIVPYTQTVSIANQGAFYPQAVEQGLDLLELQIQQIETASAYAIRAPITDLNPPIALPPAAQRANGYLAFDNNGQPYISQTAPPSGGTTTFASPRVVTTSGTATLNVLISDSFGGMSIYQTGASATTIQLPAGYGPYSIFDGGLTASTYPIQILPPAGLTILGQPSYYIAFNGASVTFYNDGVKILIG